MLRGLARATKDADQARCLLALTAIYDGGTRSEAATIGHVTLQIVRDWVVRFNARGPDGLHTGRALEHRTVKWSRLRDVIGCDSPVVEVDHGAQLFLGSPITGRGLC